MTDDEKARACAEAFRPLADLPRLKVDPVEHGVAMFKVYLRDGMHPETAAKHAIIIAIEEAKGRIMERVEKYNPHIDPETGLLR